MKNNRNRNNRERNRNNREINQKKIIKKKILSQALKNNKSNMERMNRNHNHNHNHKLNHNKIIIKIKTLKIKIKINRVMEIKIINQKVRFKVHQIIQKKPETINKRMKNKHKMISKLNKMNLKHYLLNSKIIKIKTINNNNKRQILIKMLKQPIKLKQMKKK